MHTTQHTLFKSHLNLIVLYVSIILISLSTLYLVLNMNRTVTCLLQSFVIHIFLADLLVFMNIWDFRLIINVVTEVAIDIQNRLTLTYRSRFPHPSLSSYLSIELCVTFYLPSLITILIMHVDLLLTLLLLLLVVSC